MNANALLQQFSEQQVAGFMLVIARIAPLFLVAPMFSSKMIPGRVRGLAAVGLAVGIAQMATKGQRVPIDVMGLGALALKELIVGVLISIIQAVTSIQEQTLAFIPKVVALVAIIALFGPWMLGQIETYTTALWASIPQMVGP